LQAGESADAAKMLDAMNAVPEVKAGKPRFLDILTTKAKIDDPGSQPLVDALVAAVQVTATANVTASSLDAAALATAFQNVLDAATAPAFAQTAAPFRDAVAGTSGRASDDEIAAGTFRIVPPNAQKWTLALDMRQSDVQMTGA
jgi:hypothetical protein